MTNIPASWTNTVSGDDPGFVDRAASDLRPLAASPLVNQGTTATAETSVPFPSPLTLPGFIPPVRRWMTSGAQARQMSGAPDIGAYEQTSPAPMPLPAGTGGTGSGVARTGSQSNHAPDDSGDSGCGCQTPRRAQGYAGWLLLGLIACVRVSATRRGDKMAGSDRMARTPSRRSAFWRLVTRDTPSA
jgi:hypothetical protein